MVTQKLVLGILLVWVAPVFGQERVPSRQLIAKATVAAVSKHNLVKPNVDGELCENWLEIYLNTFDPKKRYFLAGDIVEFREYLKQLPKFAMAGNLELCTLVTERYQLRAASALKFAIQRLDGNFDYAIDEELPLSYLEWPTDDADRKERWRLHLKYNLLFERSRPGSEGHVEFLKSRYESILRQSEAISEDMALGLYLNSFCRAVDPHSAYITPTEYRSFFGGMIREYSIGLAMTTNAGRSMIVRVTPGFSDLPLASQLVGCELMALRSEDGVVHNFREIFPEISSGLIRTGLENSPSVTLELFDEVRCRRFSVKWPRLCVNSR